MLEECEKQSQAQARNLRELPQASDTGNLRLIKHRGS